MKRVLICLGVVNLLIALASIPLWHAQSAIAVSSLLKNYERIGEERLGEPRDYSDQERELFRKIEQSTFDMGITMLVVHSLQAATFVIAGVSLKRPRQQVAKGEGQLQVLPLSLVSLLLVMSILLFFPLLPGVAHGYSTVLWLETYATYGRMNDGGSFTEAEYAARRALSFPQWSAWLWWFYLAQAAAMAWVCYEVNMRYRLNKRKEEAA